MILAITLGCAGVASLILAGLMVVGQYLDKERP